MTDAANGRTGTMTGHGGVGTALDLLNKAEAILLQAGRAEVTADRFSCGRLGALRAGAALLAARGALPRGGDVWAALGDRHPEFAEWAVYFAACARRHHDLERGADRPTVREADDVLRAGQTFLGLVQAALGLPVTRFDPFLAPALAVGAPEPALAGRP